MKKLALITMLAFVPMMTTGCIGLEVYTKMTLNGGAPTTEE